MTHELVAVITVPASPDATPEHLKTALAQMIEKTKRFPVDRRLDFAGAVVAVDVGWRADDRPL